MDTDALIDSYLARTPEGARASYYNPVYSLHLKWFSRLFHTLDLAMEDEGITEEIRTRVFKVALYATIEEPAELADKMVKLRRHEVSLWPDGLSRE